MNMRREAPWKDYKGQNIYEGAVIQHPVSKQRGTVVYKERENVTDSWLVDYGDFESRLCLQIGDKGRAEIIE